MFDPDKNILVVFCYPAMASITCLNVSSLNRVHDDTLPFKYTMRMQAHTGDKGKG